MFLGSLLIWFSILLVGHAKIEQIHLSFGTDETEMVVTWTDPNREIDEARVYYGTSRTNLNEKVPTSKLQFRENDWGFDTWRALLTNLEPKTDYYYQIKTFDGKSEIYKFTTAESGSDWLPQFIIYGDLGFENGRILPYLTRDIYRGIYNAIFHIGDFAYNLDSEVGEVGNKFMRSIEPLASRVPYMTCPGDQEQHANFSHYDSRFSMIGDRNNPNHGAWIDQRLNNHYHSMDIGPAHIIMFSTEIYYSRDKFSLELIERQYRWLEEDLKRADHNRVERPWIIVMGHRPLYCLRYDDPSCNSDRLERADIRRGIRVTDEDERKFGLEELFYRYRVDLQLYGHDHFYARLLPIYDLRVHVRNRESNQYANPREPIHIVTGSAGCKLEKPDFNHRFPRDWIGRRSNEYSYTRLIFDDKLTIILEQVSEGRGGKVMDRIKIVKNDFWSAYNSRIGQHLNNTNNLNKTTSNNISYPVPSINANANANVNSTQSAAQPTYFMPFDDRNVSFNQPQDNTYSVIPGYRDFNFSIAVNYPNN